MSTLSRPRLTPEEYLEIGRKAEFKSEYHDGEMFAMAGAREAQNLIVTNVIGELRRHFRARLCRAYPERHAFSSADRLEDTIQIPSIQCTLRLADLYEKVEFPAAG